MVWYEFFCCFVFVFRWEIYIRTFSSTRDLLVCDLSTVILLSL